MHEGYLNLNGVRTKVTTFGKWVEESTECNEDIIILIPGNPGINGFYDTFAKVVHEKLGHSVWCIGHAGHNIPKERLEPFPQLDANKELYGLKGQIQSKVEFLEKYMPKNGNIHIIGHSIGSYMILELLDHPVLKERNIDIYLLFPTIEYMAETRNGIFLTWIVRHIVWLLLFLSCIFKLLPEVIQNLLLNIYMFIAKIHSEHQRNLKMFIAPSLLKRVFFLAFEEMEMVRERNNEVIKRNLRKIRFLYGAKDSWAPKSYYEKLKTDIPGVDARLMNFRHAFVLNCSVEVATVVADWIKEKK